MCKERSIYKLIQLCRWRAKPLHVTVRFNHMRKERGVVCLDLEESQGVRQLNGEDAHKSTDMVPYRTQVLSIEKH